MLTLTFIAAFHVPGAKVIDRTAGYAEVIDADASNDTSSIKIQVSYDHCHVCGVAAPAAALAGRLVRLMLPPRSHGQLAAINPKTARPPPRS
ncbi:hypothetical protein [Reyranella sp.]|uniref:hypothetical protein n=1 Tax=Reyranella sp. TaxID=1929291 RepID=UPI0012EA3A44